MLRNLKKFKFFATIIVIGLSVSISIALFAIFCIFYEVSYDTFHDDYENIYRVTTTLIEKDGNKIELALVMPWVGPRLAEERPEVESVARFIKNNNKYPIEINSEKFLEDKILEVDSSFFKVFGFKLKYGDKSQVIKDPFSVVLTEEIARKYFGTDNAVGEIIKISDKNYTVAGIIENSYRNSHFSFNILIRSTFLDYMWDDQDHHRLAFVYTYVKFKKNFKLENFTNKLLEVEDKYLTSKDILDTNLKDWKLLLQPITAIHMGSNLGFEVEENISMSTIYLVLVISFIIILVAGVNYLILISALYVNRRKEIGIQKVYGAFRKDFLIQYMGESLLLAVVSLIIAVLLLRLEISLFGNLFYIKEVSLDIFLNPLFILILIGLPILLGILGGLYPSISLPSIKEINLLNSSGNKRSSRFFLLGLGGAQMITTILLLSFTYIIIQQFNYFKNKDHGFEKNNIIVVPIPSQFWNRYEAFEAELLKLPNVESVTKSLHYPGGPKETNLTKVKDGSRIMITISTCEDFVKTLGLEIIEGRDFLPGDDWESGNEKGVILNESAVKEFGWENPIGQKVESIEQRGVTDWSFRVVGVVKDFNYSSLHSKIEPMRIQMMCSRSGYALIRAKDNESKYALIPSIKKVWKSLEGKELFDYFFLDDLFNSFYVKESKLSNTFSAFSIVSIIISIMGAFGISAIIAKDKIKEIGIRKVLGASAFEIYLKNIKGFLIIIIVASLGSFPLTYFFSKKWLDKFAYSIELNIVVYILPCVIIFVIALIAFSFHTLKAFFTNPTKTLRSE